MDANTQTALKILAGQTEETTANGIRDEYWFKATVKFILHCKRLWILELSNGQTVWCLESLIPKSTRFVRDDEVAVRIERDRIRVGKYLYDFKCLEIRFTPQV